MNALNRSYEATRSVASAIGAELQGFGGILRCTVCGYERDLGDVALRLSRGWPRHCELTMRWITQSELDSMGK